MLTRPVLRPPDARRRRLLADDAHRVAAVLAGALDRPDELAHLADRVGLVTIVVGERAGVPPVPVVVGGREPLADRDRLLGDELEVPEGGAIEPVGSTLEYAPRLTGQHERVHIR